MRLEQILQAANAAIDEAARWFGSADDNMFHEQRKHSGEEVTEADITVQALISHELARQTPDIPVIGEESETHNQPDSSYWLLDPIDGTINVIRGAPYYAVSLAFIQESQPVIGVIYAPALNQRRSAIYSIGHSTKDTGSSLRQSIVGITGTSNTEPDAASLVADIHRQAYRIRMHGSMCLDLLGVAVGWIDACVCIQPHPWDVAAGIVLAREAGHVVMGPGGTFGWDSSYLIAGPLRVTQELLSIVEHWISSGK